MAGFLVGTDPGLRQTRTPTVDVLTDGVGYTSGSSTTITLTDDPGSENHVVITFDGVVQHHDTYSQSGAVITFDAAIPSGVAKIEAIFTVTVASSTVPDASVTVGKLATTGTPNGTLFLRDDMAWTAAGSGGFTSIQVFTSSGTWTKPAGINSVKVTVIGGGGGGGGTAGSDRSAGGGGGGGTAIEFIDVSSTSSETVTVGPAGTAGATSGAGGAGGTSSFGTFCSATGGAGGPTSGTGAGGLGGVGSGGDYNLAGGGGGNAVAVGNGRSGVGGNSFFGGISRTSNVSTTTITRDVGHNYGGGGESGGSGTGAETGAVGAAGIVIVEEYS